MRVGIIGMGVIGKAQARAFNEHDLVTYDPAEDEDYPREELELCDFAIVCVGTPMAEDGSANLGYIADAAHVLPLDLPVMVRSTVPPGTVDALFTGIRAHVPEFMGEDKLHPWKETTDPSFLILGGDGPSQAFFKPRLEDVFLAEIHECSVVEAEMTKYMANLYWASRVTFVNEMAGICGALGVDYEAVRRAWLSDSRVEESYTRRDGFPPGFGGRCWPKDLSALIHAAEGAAYRPEFLQSIEQANERFRAASRA